MSFIFWVPRSRIGKAPAARKSADLAIWLWTILLRGASGRAYNVGSSEGRSISDVAALVARTAGGSVGVTVARTPVPGSPARRYVPDVQRAQDELGLMQRIDLPDAIARTMRWYQTT